MLNKMKTQSLLTLLCLASALLVGADSEVDLETPPTQIPKTEESSNITSISEKSLRRVLPNQILPTLTIYLQKEGRVGIVVDENNLEAIKKISPIVRDQPLKILAHGLGENPFSESVIELSKAYYSVGANVAVIDWSYVASKPLSIASKWVYYTAINIADKIYMLTREKIIDPSKIHLIGFDLGAHVVGMIGKNSRSIYGITGLDPTQAYFSVDDPKSRIDSMDAKFVQVIHTSYGNNLGFEHPIGDADFYINGGAIQRMCLDDLYTCPHNLAWKVYARAILHPNWYLGYECSSFVDVQNDRCGRDGQRMEMGGVNLKLAQGLYYVDFMPEEAIDDESDESFLDDPPLTLYNDH